MADHSNIDNQRFIEASQADLLRFIEKRVSDNDEARGIVQDSYLKFFRAGYDATSSDARPLLFTIAKNLLNDHYRNQQKHDRVMISTPPQSQLDGEAQEADPADRLHSARTLESIIAAVESMPPKRQEVFKLSRFEGLKNQDIAERLNISKSMVEKHLAAALQDLRAALTVLQQENNSSG